MPRDAVAKADASATAAAAAHPDVRAVRNVAFEKMALSIARGGHDGVLKVRGSSLAEDPSREGGEPTAASRRPHPCRPQPAPGGSACMAMLLSH